MQTVTVSSKFQILLPKMIREELKISAGEKLVIIEKDGVIELIPVSGIKKARGIAKGVTTKNLREESERFN